MLVGRDEIQGRIARALAAARNGDGGAVALCGDPGAGKTSLPDYAVSIADGMQVRERGDDRPGHRYRHDHRRRPLTGPAPEPRRV